MKYISLIILSISSTLVFGQGPLKGIVVDSLTKRPLPFATIRFGNLQNGIITGIDGHFSLSPDASNGKLTISYVGYISKSASIQQIKAQDTIYLVQNKGILNEVVILPQTEKIKRILNTAIRNKNLNNPELYDAYQCYVYYKMHVDLIFTEHPKADPAGLKINSDTIPGTKAMANLPEPDSSLRERLKNSHVVFSETYSKRSYKRPLQLQEDIIASRFSGLKKTYFTNLVTDVLPFHVYGDYISLNGKDYVNPVAKGWQQRYHFNLVDEINSDGDTIFILSFRPKKNVVFNSLNGMLYINTNGYAISHFISSTADSAEDRETRIEQIYTRVDGKWFPKELNYDLILKKYPSAKMGVKLNGHSVIDSISFRRSDPHDFDKARPVRLVDSVDLHSDKDWEKLRPDSITGKEINTYHFMDSLAQKVKLENVVHAFGMLAIGRLGIRCIDLDLTRLVAYNSFEGTRLGIGGFTNDQISKYYSIGGWFGYGLSDKTWKYGASATIFPGGNKDNWVSFSYQNNYQSVGNVNIHPDLDKNWLRGWLLAKVDRFKEYSLTFHTQRGYWEIELNGKNQFLESLYNNNFEISGKNLTSYSVNEGSIGIKYAYAQLRVPLFGYYFPYTTRYPIIYFKFSAGNITSPGYSANYFRSLGAVTFTKHLNRWGNDNFRIEGGLIHTLEGEALSRSFLLAARGFESDQFNYFAFGGFLTMHPYDYFSDRYVSFMYKHDFDKCFWHLSFSQPFLSLIHNMMYGGLTNSDKQANAGIATPATGYQETGILINQLFQYNYLHIANIYFNTGPFYHWASTFDLRKNTVWVVGISAGF
jgi:hypothetical protein